jgi:hypothetical protein
LNGHGPNNFKLFYPTNHYIPLGHRFNLDNIIGRALFGGHYGCKTPLDNWLLLLSIGYKLLHKTRFSIMVVRTGLVMNH